MTKNEKTSKVAVAICSSYDFDKVYAAIKAGVDAVGGIAQYAHAGEKILVKPNFLYPSEAEKVITTNPAVISAFLKLMSQETDCQVLIGDSPANGSCRSAANRLDLSEGDLYGAELADMSEEVDYRYPAGRIAKRFSFVKEATEVDGIIGLCKMKTHMLERVTGALKNMYGLICGMKKAAGHVKYPTAVKFAKMLCDLYKATPQRLHIMDGIVAMEGNGPASGNPIDMGVILVSSDPIALDTTFCKLVVLQPEMVPTNVQGQFAKIGTCDTDRIEIIRIEEDGTKKEGLLSSDILNDLRKPEFDVRRESDRVNVLTLLSRLSGGNRKPVIDDNLCISCGICVNHCPVEGKAVNFEDGKDKPPVYNYKKCIRCYCCQELCPQKAISVR